MWCSEQLGQLQNMLNRMEDTNVQLLAVSTDSAADSRRMARLVREAQGLELTFPMLGDTDHRVIDLYGLRNPGAAPGPSTRVFAVPATFVIDREGIVRWRLVEENWKVRPSNQLIVAVIDRVKEGRDATDLVQSSFAYEADPTAPADRPREVVGADQMVRLEGGTYFTGKPGETEGDSPEREIELSSFRIDKYETTNREYRQFLEAAESSSHDYCHPLEPADKDHTPAFQDQPELTRPDAPVVGVDWFDAYAYCAWRGLTLPTEAQWEVAARAGIRDLSYPWGDEIDESQANLYLGAGEAGAVMRDRGHSDPDATWETRGPKPVGSYQPNALGIHDLQGNVEEWSLDWYDPDFYRTGSRQDPMGPSRGTVKVVRGASWHHAKGRFSTRYTHPPDRRSPFTGFRCAGPAPER